ncbi:MAG: phasin family protein [Candidatus Azotimanducaceae bacterium WSBS_2022_MAG_OTU7]
MNMIEKQAKLGKSLYEINTTAMSEIAEMSRKNIEQYFEVNRSFGEKLPEVKEVGSFVSLQREYGETLFNNAREAMEAQTALMQSAFAEARDAVQSAFAPEAPEAPETAKPKAKAKKAA